MTRYIFTGTPGAGKTKTLQALKEKGYTVISEAVTDLIADCQMNGVMEPWTDPMFIEAIVFCQKQRQIEAEGDFQLYDRSPFCTIALEKYLKFQPVASLLEEANRCIKLDIYSNKVFFFENLGFIQNTEIRKISYEESLIFEKIHLDVYKDFGFDVIMVPRGTIEERCNFIEKHIKE
jgi:predicted ATPase